MMSARKVFSMIEHESINGEFDNLLLLDDAEFQKVRTRHLNRRATAAEPTNAGVCFILSLVSAPGCLVAWLFNNEPGYFFGALFWSAVGMALYIYLAHSAKYWREHRAILTEEVRRFGATSFG